MADYLPFKDISYAQGLWNMDADSDPIVAMKASGFYTGSKLPYLDDQLVRNYADAIRLGKVPVLYHFAGGSDAATEAAYFIAAIHPLAEGDVYALDWEIEQPDPVGWVNTFMQKVHDATAAWPLLYLDIDRLNRFDWSPILKNCGLWLAAPSYGFDQTIPNVHHEYVAQQGPIVNGVDTDAWFGTLEELKAYGYHKPQTQSAAPAQPAPAPSLTPAPTPEPQSPAPAATTPTPTPNPSSPEKTTVTGTSTDGQPIQVKIIPPYKAPGPAPTPKRNWFVQFLLDLVKGL